MSHMRDDDQAILLNSFLHTFLDKFSLHSRRYSFSRSYVIQTYEVEIMRKMIQFYNEHRLRLSSLVLYNTYQSGAVPNVSKVVGRPLFGPQAQITFI